MESLDYNKLPLSTEECGKILSIFREAFLNKDLETLKKLNEEYIETLSKWGALLNALSFIIESYNRCESRGLNLKELKEKGFIR